MSYTSYRDPETPSKKPIHRRQFSYDADEEDHALDFNPNDFILPDGTQPLDPAVIQRIEDATKLLRELEVNKEMEEIVAPSPGRESSASNKENEEPETILKNDDVDYDGDDDDMVFGKTSTPKGAGKERVRSSAGEMVMDEDAETDDTLRIGVKLSGSTSKRNQKDRTTSLDDANTEIWLLKSIVKDQEREIRELKKIIADQAAQAELMNGAEVHTNRRGKFHFSGDYKHPSFTIGLDERDSPFYSRPSRHDPDETVEEDPKPERTRKEKMPLFFKKMHMEQRKRKVAWAEEDKEGSDRNTGRAKKAKHTGSPLQFDNTKLASDIRYDSKVALGSLSDWGMSLGGSDCKEMGVFGGHKAKLSREDRHLTIATAENEDSNFDAEGSSTSSANRDIFGWANSMVKKNGVGTRMVGKSEDKGGMRGGGVVDAEDEIDIYNKWMPTGDLAKDSLTLSKMKAEIKRLKQKRAGRQPREKQVEELKAMKGELKEMEE
ncbi:uncharacterized protein PAC_17213 [Phialocephala subalpina]|uniref:Uncharacterized protein n=1 Tax=Phialocephala subalpina TaxID=576137 RepID=A0A1L7XQJ5_9HELO|nr:uncharacterized protein PAC_17213 [Phialocephala subalpina]